MHYEGRLIDGTVFDSSYARGEPISFPLTGVIAGWTEGLQLMKVAIVEQTATALYNEHSAIARGGMLAFQASFHLHLPCSAIASASATLPLSLSLVLLPSVPADAIAAA